ncbi:MAG TPA: NADH-quinone oxidoreductase subunit NuoE [Candidatus Lokiarchaeia archaeon]|nr:NADH-quinone oxidoreductase subunit NuoE [Candidatus Lokiarchaeia archaeon]
MMDAKFDAIVENGLQKKAGLIALLQEIQDTYGYISREAVAELAKKLKISESHIYGVATFYAQFRFEKPGRHKISVCKGTSCFVMGSSRLLELLEEKLDITSGHTTPDARFSLEAVYCLGCCAISPVISVDGKVFGNVTPKEIDKILKKYDD